MIEVPRSTLRQFRAVLRRSVLLSCPRSLQMPVMFFASADGVSIRCQREGMAVSLDLPGGHTSETISVASTALETLEKAKDTVTLEARSNSVHARWNEAGAPREMDFEKPSQEPTKFPELPNRSTENGREILEALHDAMQTATHDSVRFATQKIQLRGRQGEIIATDGRQLLCQGGFRFAWTEELLIPRVTAFGSLSHDGSVFVGKTNDHVCVRMEPWTFWLPIDKDSRYPKTENIIPKMNGAATTLVLDREDADFLVKTLPGLPGADQNYSPITVDLNGHVAIRSRGEGQARATEVVLSRSEIQGQPTRFAVDRTYLARALELGFTKVTVPAPDSPILCENERRRFVFVALSKDLALAPGKDDVRIESSSAQTRPCPQPEPAKKKESLMKTPRFHEPEPPAASSDGNGHKSGDRDTDVRGDNNGDAQRKVNSFHALLEEAQSLQNTLRDALLRTNQLLAGLKGYRRQAKAMQSTLQSLRHLQQVDA